MRKIILLLATTVAIAVVAMIAMVLPERGAGPAEANDPAVEFFMEIKAVNQTNSAAACSTKGKLAKEKGDLVCSIPLNGTLNVSVELNNAGGAAGLIGAWQAVVGWTPGLTGPGDAGPPKALSVKNCSGIAATAAPFAAQTAAGYAPGSDIASRMRERMKLVVPLRMPRIAVIFPPIPPAIVRTTGMPPPTAASYAKMVFRDWASCTWSAPVRLRTALLAVTTHLPAHNAS